MGKLEPLNSSSTLLADVSDDMSDCIGLVSQVTVGNIDDAHLAIALTVSETIREAGFHLRGYVFPVDLAMSVGS